MRQNRWMGPAMLGVLFLIALCTAGSASAQDVRYNFMPGTNFANFHTYRWITIKGGVSPNPIMDAQIKQSVDSQLASKGLMKTDSDNADLSIGYQVAVNQQKQWNAWGTGRGVGFGGGMASATSSTIDIGTMDLDMYNTKDKQLVWTGSATKTIDPSNNQEKNQKNLDKAMAKLLKNYPPKSK